MSTESLPNQDHVTLIRPSAGWRAVNLSELWRYRELLLFLTMRDIKLRYKQTALGVAWVVLQPLASTTVFALFFGKLAKMPSDNRPYSLFVLAALLPWQLFAYALTQSSNSLVNERGLISKVYFPRLIIPVASVLSGLMDFIVTFTLMCLALAWYGVTPGIEVLALIPFTALALFTALSTGLWLSALNVQYRDIRYTIPFLTQFWMFATPVAYPSSIVPPEYRFLYGINPMAGVVEGFRWSLLDTDAPDWGMVSVSVLTVSVLFTGSVLYFRRLERIFADIA